MSHLPTRFILVFLVVSIIFRSVGVNNIFSLFSQVAAVQTTNNKAGQEFSNGAVFQQSADLIIFKCSVGTCSLKFAWEIVEMACFDEVRISSFGKVKMFHYNFITLIIWL